MAFQVKLFFQILWLVTGKRCDVALFPGIILELRDDCGCCRPCGSFRLGGNFSFCKSFNQLCRFLAWRGGFTNNKCIFLTFVVEPLPHTPNLIHPSGELLLKVLDAMLLLSFSCVFFRNFFLPCRRASGAAMAIHNRHGALWSWQLGLAEPCPLPFPTLLRFPTLLIGAA